MEEERTEGKRKEEYQKQFQSRIEELEAKLDRLKSLAKQAESDLRTRLQKEEREIREKLDEARTILKELRAASEDGWDEMKSGAEKLFKDVWAAWERTSRERAAAREQSEGRPTESTGAGPSSDSGSAPPSDTPTGTGESKADSDPRGT